MTALLHDGLLPILRSNSRIYWSASDFVEQILRENRSNLVQLDEVEFVVP